MSTRSFAGRLEDRNLAVLRLFLHIRSPCPTGEQDHRPPRIAQEKLRHGLVSHRSSRCSVRGPICGKLLDRDSLTECPPLALGVGARRSAAHHTGDVVKLMKLIQPRKPVACESIGATTGDYNDHGRSSAALRRASIIRRKFLCLIVRLWLALRSATFSGCSRRNLAAYLRFRSLHNA